MFLWQPKSADEEGSHLGAVDILQRAEVAAAAACGDAFSGQLLDPSDIGGIQGYISKAGAGSNRWGSIAAATVFAAQQEDGHLGAVDFVEGAVVASPAAGGDGGVGQSFDPAPVTDIHWHIAKGWRCGRGVRRPGTVRCCGCGE